MITCRPYRVLCDFERLYLLMSRAAGTNAAGGMPAPFIAYAHSFPEFAYAMSHRIGLFEQNGEPVAAAFFEVKLGTALFSYLPGYEHLAGRLIQYAEQNLADEDGRVRLWLLNHQTALRSAARRRGYRLTDSWPMGILDYGKPMPPKPLPDGFHFLAQGAAFDLKKLNACLWRGFDHGDHPDGQTECYRLAAAAPHARTDLSCVAVAPNGDYACYGGMWMDHANRMAYLEPLCCVPSYRRLGVASAVIAELRRRTKAEGAACMTGGSHPFYASLGFETGFVNEIYAKDIKIDE